MLIVSSLEIPLSFTVVAIRMTDNSPLMGVIALGLLNRVDVDDGILNAVIYDKDVRGGKQCKVRGHEQYPFTETGQ